MFELIISLFFSASVALVPTAAASGCPAGQPHTDFGGGKTVVNPNARIRICGDTSVLESGIYRPCSIRPSVVIVLPSRVNIKPGSTVITNCNTSERK